MGRAMKEDPPGEEGARAPEPTAVAPGLYLVGTPIGHLRDITLRALDVLRAADLILAEDTRRARILLERHAVRAPLLSCHQFNEMARAETVIDRLRDGAIVALISEAGMPGVSDPGARLVAACRSAKLPVFVVPGPSAVTAAFALAGMTAPGFVFGGFLPHRPGPRRRALERLSAAGLPIVLFEAPHRLLKLLDELQVRFGEQCRVVVARELTKLHEETIAGTPAELKELFTKRNPRGEFTIIIECRAEGQTSSADESGESYS